MLNFTSKITKVHCPEPTGGLKAAPKPHAFEKNHPPQPEFLDPPLFILSEKRTTTPDSYLRFCSANRAKVSILEPGMHVFCADQAHESSKLDFR